LVTFAVTLNAGQMEKPKTLEELIRVGGPEAFVREAMNQAARNERQYWLDMLEGWPLPRGEGMASIYAKYARDLRRRLRLGQAPAVVREQTRERMERLRSLGNWGEKKAIDLLRRAGFTNVTELNTKFPNHQFGDICAERADGVYLIAVKTRNKYQTNGLLNPTFNVRERGVDVWAIAQRYSAEPAWVAISCIPEQQKFSAYHAIRVPLASR
jgi:hypothetical protein